MRELARAHVGFGPTAQLHMVHSGKSDKVTLCHVFTNAAIARARRR
jgi:hypothetical protein